MGGGEEGFLGEVDGRWKGGLPRGGGWEVERRAS